MRLRQQVTEPDGGAASRKDACPDVHRYEGDTVELMVEVDAESLPSEARLRFVWRKNESEVRLGARYGMQQSPRCSRLRITDLSTVDTGCYSCQVLSNRQLPNVPKPQPAVFHLYVDEHEACSAALSLQERIRRLHDHIGCTRSPNLNSLRSAGTPRQPRAADSQPQLITTSAPAASREQSADIDSTPTTSGAFRFWTAVSRGPSDTPDPHCQPVKSMEPSEVTVSPRQAAGGQPEPTYETSLLRSSTSVNSEAVSSPSDRYRTSQEAQHRLTTLSSICSSSDDVTTLRWPKDSSGDVSEDTVKSQGIESSCDDISCSVRSSGDKDSVTDTTGITAAVQSNEVSVSVSSNQSSRSVTNQKTTDVSHDVTGNTVTSEETKDSLLALNTDSFTSPEFDDSCNNLFCGSVTSPEANYSANDIINDSVLSLDVENTFCDVVVNGMTSPRHADSVDDISDIVRSHKFDDSAIYVSAGDVTLQKSGNSMEEVTGSGVISQKNQDSAIDVTADLVASQKGKHLVSNITNDDAVSHNSENSSDDVTGSCVTSEKTQDSAIDVTVDLVKLQKGELLVSNVTSDNVTSQKVQVIEVTSGNLTPEMTDVSTEVVFIGDVTSRVVENVANDAIPAACNALTIDIKARSAARTASSEPGAVSGQSSSSTPPSNVNFPLAAGEAPGHAHGGDIAGGRRKSLEGAPPSPPDERQSTLGRESDKYANAERMRRHYVQFRSEATTPEEIPFADRKVEIKVGVDPKTEYEMLERIGRGGFSEVFRCREFATGEVLAAKVARYRASTKSSLLYEIEILRQLRHPRVMRLYDVFDYSRRMTLITEYIAGGELCERIIEDNFLSEEQASNFIVQILRGVNYLHSQSVIHLDLKPENIVCKTKTSYDIKIIDFGFAQLYEGAHKPIRFLGGTANFTAPEVVNYEPLTFAADVWAVGVMTFLLLSGYAPFDGDSDQEVLVNVTKGDYEYDDECFEEISSPAREFIDSILIKNPSKRPTAKQLLNDEWLRDRGRRSTLHLPVSVSHMRNYMNRAREKWKAVTNAIMAMQKLQHRQVQHSSPAANLAGAQETEAV